MSQRLSVYQSVWLSVCGQWVLWKCYDVVCIFMLLLLLLVYIIRTLCCHILIFSCDSSSKSPNVSPKQPVYDLYCLYKVIHVVVIIVYDHLDVAFLNCNKAAIAALYVTMLVWLSVGPSVCLSVCGQRVFWKCYHVVSAFMLLLLL